MGAQELQVLDVVLATDALGDDVVNLQDATRELVATLVAPTFLLTKKNVLVLAIGHWRVNKHKEAQPQPLGRWIFGHAHERKTIGRPSQFHQHGDPARQFLDYRNQFEHMTFGHD